VNVDLDAVRFLAVARRQFDDIGAGRAELCVRWTGGRVGKGDLARPADLLPRHRHFAAPRQVIVLDVAVDVSSPPTFAVSLVLASGPPNGLTSSTAGARFTQTFFVAAATSSPAIARFSLFNSS